MDDLVELRRRKRQRQLAEQEEKEAERQRMMKRLQEAKSRRGKEEGDNSEATTACRKLLLPPLHAKSVIAKDSSELFDKAIECKDHTRDKEKKRLANNQQHQVTLNGSKSAAKGQKSTTTKISTTNFSSAGVPSDGISLSSSDDKRRSGGGWLSAATSTKPTTTYEKEADKRSSIRSDAAKYVESPSHNLSDVCLTTAKDAQLGGSPHSSVTFSQDPTKRTTPEKNVFAEETLESPTANSGEEQEERPRSPIAPSRRQRRPRADSSSSDDSFDILALAERKEKGALAQQSVTSNHCHGDSEEEGDPEPDTSPSKTKINKNDDWASNRPASTTTRLRVSQTKSQSGGVDSDRGTASPRNPQENHSEYHRNLRNPLVLMREEKESVAPVSPTNLSRTATVMDNDALFADPTNEDRHDETKQSKKKNEGRKRGTDKKKSAIKPAASSPAENKYLGRSSLVGLPELSDGNGTVDDGSTEPKPQFSTPKFGPFSNEPLLLGPDEFGRDHMVPSSIARYLPSYQREGIEFMYKAMANNRGAILGDDMGLGKTIQTVSLVAALLGKKGTLQDLIDIRNRINKVDERHRKKQDAIDKALRLGNFYTDPTSPEDALIENPWAPILVVAPKSVVNNWVTDFSLWGYFAMAVFDNEDNYSGIDAIREGLAELLIVGHPAFTNNTHFEKLLQVPWKVVVVDEFHVFKNSKGKMSDNLRTIRDQHEACILGLTGTPMQNNHAELWNLVDIVGRGLVGPWKVFEQNFAKPLKLARAKDATDDVIEMGRRKGEELNLKLDPIYLCRTKESVLKNELPRKDERIVFCGPSPLQTAIYKHMLKQPDFTLVSEAHLPCQCGVNEDFFNRMQSLPTRDEKVDYFRKHKKSVIMKSKCCYTSPKTRNGEIDPRAVIWRNLTQHAGDEACEKCPFCLLFPALHLLLKVSTHVALIQPKLAPESLPEGKQRVQAQKDLEIARAFIPADVVSQLPGGSLIRQDNIMNDHFALSGKMKVLAGLLEKIDRLEGRVLLFSGSTSTLDLIECFVQTTGYSFLRMDGTTPQKKRIEIADEFKANNNIFVFLLSTKAMGLGLNLTSASWVIIFDVEWNPTYDLQAQDRSYRIGQSKDVKVFRLVSRGTIEEMKYLRQVYKTQLKSDTIAEPGSSERDAKRIFRGVAGDDNRRGEIFGLANLTRFEENGTFMNYGEEANEASQFNSSIYDMETFLSAAEAVEEDGNKHAELRAVELVQKVSEESNPSILCVGAPSSPTPDTLNETTKRESETLGGESQALLDFCDDIPRDSATLFLNDRVQEGHKQGKERVSIAVEAACQIPAVRRARDQGKKPNFAAAAAGAAAYRQVGEYKKQKGVDEQNRKSSRRSDKRSVPTTAMETRTTFTASDLALPSGMQRKKKKKSS